MKLHIDFETRSAVDLKKAGVVRYAASPTTRVMCMSWAFDDDLPRTSNSQVRPPREVLNFITRGGTVVAHNAAFEFYIWNHVFAKRHELKNVQLPKMPPLKWEQLDCTMARAYQMGLPGSLDGALQALGTKIRKDTEGKKIMLRLSKPYKWVDGDPLFHTLDPNGAEFRKLKRYCEADVLAEAELDRLLPPLQEREQKLWYIDKAINQRGVPFDMDVVQKAADVAVLAVDRANQQLAEITGGIAGTINQRDKILDFVRQNGHDMPDLRKDTAEKFLAEMPDDAAKEALQLRKQYSKASVAKFSKILDWHASGRVHGTMEYHGAHTGRWAGRGPQLQNLRRYDDENPEERDRVTWMLDMLRTLKPGDVLDACELMGEEILDTLSLSLRRSITAPSGKVLVGADFSNIEGRVAAWIAGEQWKLEAYREFDQGTGPDLYKVTASQSLNTPMSQIDKKLRQIGKVMELALGFQGGVDAVNRFVSDDDLVTMAQTALSISPEGSPEYDKAERQWKRTVTDTAPDIWIGIKVLVNKWREANANICQCWYDLNDAMIKAVQFRGSTTKAAKCEFVANDKFLYLKLPTGRVMSYPDPRIGTSPSQWIDDKGNIKVDHNVCVIYQRRNQKVALYGGLIWENVVQATARDALAESLIGIHGKHKTIAHTHDEILVEVPESSDFDDKKLVAIMQNQPLLEGCPIAAAGWTAREYSK